MLLIFFFFFQAEDGIRDYKVTGVQTCALPIYGVPTLVDQTLVLLEQGLGAGVTPPRITLRDVPQQITELIPDSALASPLLKPFTHFPAAIGAAERARLAAAAGAA